jgi:hypothetical protein
VTLLLGRAPASGFQVSVRCPHGGPAVIRNAPRDVRGDPFPTRQWLCCRALAHAVSRLESEGGVRRLEEDPGMGTALAEVQARHAALHAGHAVAGAGDPARVKCLHAHLAFDLADGEGRIAEWILRRAGATWPADRCCAEAAA